MKNKILVLANWKMNPGTAEKAKEIFRATKAVAKDLKNIKVVVCPPFVYLSNLEKLNGGTPMSRLILGAQDMFWEKEGSFTGEISPNMLSGEGYVIIGHSERRELGETDEVVAKKLIAAIKAGLKPILCVGERVRDDHGEYLHLLRNQIINSLGKLTKRYLAKLVIAYEPVWAIGKSEDEAMKPEDIHVMTIFIKKILSEIYKNKKVMEISILYGGSVGHNNAKEIITLGEVQGLLVGRESLNSKKFGELLKNVNSI
jgi:triosephosphate isomerase